MNIYVGNLAWKARKQDLTELFEHFGDVSRAFIVRDKRTRRSKGFGFVEMPNEEQALVAIEALHNTVFMERAIVVNEANPRKDDDIEDLDESDDDETTSARTNVAASEDAVSAINNPGSTETESTITDTTDDTVAESTTTASSETSAEKS